VAASEPFLFRAFKPEDGVASLGFLPNMAAVGVTAEATDGSVAGYGGFHIHEGRHWVFFHLGDESLRQPMLLHRMVARGIAAAVRAGIGPIHALCEEDRPRAREWLRRLGFRPMRPDEKDAGIMELERHPQRSAWVREKAAISGERDARMPRAGDAP
jgi:N-acetylglutamate synthase-like GNAT family acetyltransferase